MLLISLAAVCILLSGCRPCLSLNPKYSYSSFEIQIGDRIPGEISEYIDLSGLSAEDAEFICKNTELLYDSAPVQGDIFDGSGRHTLTIQYCGHQYRRYDINIADSEAPEFTSVRNVYTFEGLPLPEDVTEGMFEAEDNSGRAEITVAEPAADYYSAGKYPVMAVASDPSGNKARETAFIIVQKPEYGAEGTYVYISIGEQKLTYFENGKVRLECPVVTGNIYTDHATPRGTYSLNYKSQNVTLKGTEDNGDKYESFVNYWMAFIGSSVGMHDASWRNVFGGNIYMGGGSHGCVNMPMGAAAELFSLIEPGTPVLVY